MGSRPAKCTVEALETAGSADPRPGRDGVFSSEGTIQGLKPRRKNLLLSCHFKRFIPASRPSGPLGSPLPRPPRVANRPPRPLTRRPNPAYSVRVRTYMPLGTFGVVRRTRTPVQPLAEYVRILAYFHRVGRILEIPISFCASMYLGWAIDSPEGPSSHHLDRVTSCHSRASSRRSFHDFRRCRPCL